MRDGLPVCFQRGLPVFVQGFQTGLELDVSILVSDGLDGIAPGGGLTEQVFQFVCFLFNLADLAFNVDGLAVSKLSLRLGGRRRRRPLRIETASRSEPREQAFWPVLCPPAPFP